MSSSLIIFSTFVIAASSLPTPTLKSELDQFKDVINFQRISEIAREYYENDVSVQNLIKYLRSDKFRSAAEIFMKTDEVDDITEWMKSHGVDLKAHMLDFEAAISGTYQAASFLSFEKFSYQTFEDEIRGEIQSEQMNVLIEELLSDGNDFAHLYLILNVSRQALENIFKQEDIQAVMVDIEELGVNIEYLKTVIYEILRWQ